MLFDKPSQLRRSLALAGALLLAVPAVSAEGGSSPEEVYQRLRTAFVEKEFSEVVLCIEPEKRPLFSLTLYIGASMFVALAASMGEVMAEVTGEMAVGLGEGLVEGLGGEISEQERAQMEEQAASFKAQAKATTDNLEAQLQAVLDEHGLGHLTDENTEFDNSGGFTAIANEIFGDIDHGAFAGDLLRILNQTGEGKIDGFTSKYPDTDLTDVVVTGRRATGKAGEKEIEFVEVDGRWYLTLAM